MIMNKICKGFKNNDYLIDFSNAALNTVYSIFLNFPFFYFCIFGFLHFPFSVPFSVNTCSLELVKPDEDVSAQPKLPPAIQIIMMLPVDHLQIITIYQIIIQKKTNMANMVSFPVC